MRWSSAIRTRIRFTIIERVRPRPPELSVCAQDLQTEYTVSFEVVVTHPCVPLAVQLLATLAQATGRPGILARRLVFSSHLPARHGYGSVHALIEQSVAQVIDHLGANGYLSVPAAERVDRIWQESE